MPKAPDIDLSDLSVEEFQNRLGAFVQLSLQRSGACVLVARSALEICLLDPSVLNTVPDEDMATALLQAGWSEEDVLRALEKRGTAGAPNGA